MLLNGDLPTEDFHLISSCPCWAYTRHSNGQITVGCRSCLTILANYYLPLNVALMPHFEGTLFINNSAAGSLIAKGGPIENIFGATITATQKAAAIDRLGLDFYAYMLPNDLLARG